MRPVRRTKLLPGARARVRRELMELITHYIPDRTGLLTPANDHFKAIVEPHGAGCKQPVYTCKAWHCMMLSACSRSDQDFRIWYERLSWIGNADWQVLCDVLATACPLGMTASVRCARL